MKQKRTVRHADGAVTVDVRRSQRRRKTVELKVTRDGTVTVYAPVATPDSFIDDFVRDRIPWIREQLAKFTDVSDHAAAAGRTMPFRGEAYPVRWDRTLPWATTGVTWSPSDGFRVDVSDGDGLAEVERAFEYWYRAQFTPIILDAVAKRWIDMNDGKAPPLIRMSTAKKRWGSCTQATRIVRFSWRALTLDDDLLDMVIVHELAHLVHANHSPEYYRHVERFRPDQARAHKRLRQASHSVPF